jgi:hypothetical protein
VLALVAVVGLDAGNDHAAEEDLEQGGVGQQQARSRIHDRISAP